MSGIICCACSILAISVLQFALYNGETISSRFRRRAKWRFILNLIARTPSFVSSSTSVSLGKRHYGSQDPCRSIAGEDRSGWLDKEIHSFISSFRTSIPCFSPTSYSKLDDDRAWSSQEWKAAATTYDRWGRLDKTSLRMARKVRSDHEEILLDGTAQSLRSGETLRDRSGRLDSINSQEVARPRNFVNRIGIVCRIKIIRESVEWSSAKKTEKFPRCRRMWRTFYYLVNVYGSNDGISDIHGKEFPNQS